jgi:hypothetical protein
MTLIPLNLSADAQVVGRLPDTSNIHDLTQDMLQVSLPGDVFVDVGWYPDWDPNGSYRIIVFQDEVENQLEAPFCSRDVQEVRDVLYTTVDKYLQPVRQQAGMATNVFRLLRGNVIENPISAISNRFSRTLTVVPQ